MVRYKGQEVIIIDVDIDTERITVLFESYREKKVKYCDLKGDEKEINDEFKRLKLIHTCLNTIGGTIKPTDGSTKSLLRHINTTEPSIVFT